MKRSNIPGGHIAGFIACYVAAVLASALSATFFSYISADAGIDGTLHEVFTILLALAGFTLAASILALPAVVLAYPLALFLARHLVTPLRTAIAGAVLGPPVGIAATLLFFRLTGGPGPTSASAQAFFLLPIAFTAGAAMGWAAATLQRRNTD